jgi:hypothetical protein
MKKTVLPVLAVASVLLFASCEEGTPKTENANTTDSVTAAPPPVALGGVTASPEFPNATIAVSARAEKAGKDSAKVSFVFDVKNYELKMQTSDNSSKQCNNSAQGQHIHFILDNQPYKALYDPKNEITLANNTEHYLMAFLSRSYHESVKSKGAAVVYHFSIDAKGNLKKLDEPKTPMLFYSRPKGDYIGNDTTNLLLDYYVWNCQLGADSFKVKAEISNENKPTQQLTATLDKWEPKFIQNLGSGKCKVTLTLVDKTGKEVDGPLTTVSRNFNTIVQEPIKQ